MAVIAARIQQRVSISGRMLRPMYCQEKLGMYPMSRPGSDKLKRRVPNIWISCARRPISVDTRENLTRDNNAVENDGHKGEDELQGHQQSSLKNAHYVRKYSPYAIVVNNTLCKPWYQVRVDQVCVVAENVSRRGLKLRWSGHVHTTTWRFASWRI